MRQEYQAELQMSVLSSFQGSSPGTHCPGGLRSHHVGSKFANFLHDPVE